MFIEIPVLLGLYFGARILQLGIAYVKAEIRLRRIKNGL